MTWLGSKFFLLHLARPMTPAIKSVTMPEKQKEKGATNAKQSSAKQSSIYGTRQDIQEVCSMEGKFVGGSKGKGCKIPKYSSCYQWMTLMQLVFPMGAHELYSQDSIETHLDHDEHLKHIAEMIDEGQSKDDVFEHLRKLKLRYSVAAKRTPYEAINFLRLHQYHYISQETKRLLKGRDSFKDFAASTTAQLESGKDEAIDQGGLLDPKKVSTSALPTGTGDDSDNDTTDDDQSIDGEAARL